MMAVTRRAASERVVREGILDPRYKPAARPRSGSRGSGSNQFSPGASGSTGVEVGAILGAGFGGGPGLKGRGGGGGCVEWARRRMLTILEGHGRIGGIAEE
jgi:hypothetical protein